MTISTSIYFFLVLRTHAKIDNTVFCFNSSWEHCLKQTMRIIFLISLIFGDHYFITPTENFYHLHTIFVLKIIVFFALLSDHDAFGIMIFHQRNGKWFLRPKQRGLNSVDLFIKEPLFLPLTTADCAEETEKSRSRQRWAKNNNFSKQSFSLIVVGPSLRLCTCQILICPHPVKMKGIGKNSPLFRVLKTWKQRYVGIAFFMNDMI